METCSEVDAKFMSESLLSHAREICRYAKTYSEPTLVNQLLEERNREKFSRTVERMIKEMYTLLLMAGAKGADRFCNREQIDAYMDEARLAVSVPGSARQSTPQYN